MTLIPFSDSLPGGPRVPCVKLEDQRHEFVLLGGVATLFIHWMGQVSEPCLGPECPKTIHRRRAYERSYCAAIKPDKERHVVGYDQSDWVLLPFSPYTLAELERKHGALRAIYVLFDIHHKKRRCTLVKSGPVKDPSKLPPDFDPVPHVYRLFGRQPPAIVPATIDQVPAQPLPVDLDAVIHPLEKEIEESSSNTNRRFADHFRSLEKKNGKPQT